ncbi:ABC transporter permease [Achromobacter aegrifaciens]
MSPLRRLWRNTAVRFCVIVLMILALIAIVAPWLGTVDPAAMDAGNINVPAGHRGEMTLADGTVVNHTFLMGSDNFGRDVWSRVVYGTRISLAIALITMLLALLVGGGLGLLAGYFKSVDVFLMRVLDGLMSIPPILMAVALVASLGPSIPTVAIAIALPEVPRVARLLRSIVLGLRSELFVEAAQTLGTPSFRVMFRHVLPNAWSPLLVQGTFIAASAVLTEALLSFLGVGLPADVPTWGNVMAEGRVQFTQYPGIVFFPALFLVPTVLAINLLGDGLRDVLDPKFNRSRA